MRDKIQKTKGNVASAIDAGKRAYKEERSN
jgi:hypothetical protein